MKVESGKVGEVLETKVTSWATRFCTSLTDHDLSPKKTHEAEAGAS